VVAAQEQLVNEPPRAAILVVDDYPANLLALEAILAPLGHEVVRANSGPEALKAVLKQEFALIILDVQMPDMDGFQTASLIKTRDRSRHIPIVFLTAISKDAAHVFQGYEHGAVDYLLKPFDGSILRRKVAVFVDLWQRGELLKQREAELRLLERDRLERESQARYQALIEAMPQCVLAMRPNGTPYYCNQVWTTYSGLDCNETGERMWERVHADDRDRVRLEWLDSRTKQCSLATELRLLRAGDDEARWHLMHVRPQLDNGVLRGWIATATDIHDEKKARDEAERASRAKDEFLATVSHELRNPLNAILGWTRMLRAGKLDATKSARALEAIERNADVQASLVEDMLDVSRIITGKLLLNVSAVDMRQVATAALDTVRMAAEAKQIDVRVLLEDEAQLLSGDAERLQQVAWNLLSNAIKFTPRGGWIELRTRRDGSQAELSVRDSGQGICRDFLPHVFERFRQADSSSTRVHGGLGLGLAIVRHLVELHGGTVGVTSDGEGMGATFTVRLPLRAVAPEGDDLPAPARGYARAVRPLGEPSLLEGVRVLVVDDEHDARELLAAVLEHHGAVVLSAGNVDEALASLSSANPDVLVSDIGMPGADGYELMRRVRAGTPPSASIAAAALTGFARPEDGRRALDSGFDAHLAKPADPATLVETVERLARLTAVRQRSSAVAAAK
jgi:PAS domain S-box-containing protein